MLRSIRILVISGLFGSVALAARTATVRRDAPKAPAAAPGSIRYTPPQTRTPASPTSHGAVSGSIRYAPPRSTSAPVARPSTPAVGSIHFSKPSVPADTHPQRAADRDGGVHRGAPDDRHPRPPIAGPGAVRPSTPVITIPRPLLHHSTGESSVWHRPPIRQGYRPPIATPLRGFDRSRWRTVLRPWNVVPTGGGYGELAIHGRPYGYRHYIYRPDGGRICYYRPPAWGMVYPSLPPGAITFVFGSRPYYCWAGVYYIRLDSGYRVVRPPLGAVVSYLPPDYSYMDVNGIRYFYSNSVYYTYVPPEADDFAVGRTLDDDEGSEGYYAVVAPPIGAEVAELPTAYQTVIVNGQTWYRIGDEWYLPVYEGDTLRYLRAPEPR